MNSDSQPASRVTIEDIARKAGVHRSTVSRALRGDVRITPETRDRIQRIAEDLQYEPNFLAKGLAGQGTRTVGILAPYLRDGFYVAIVSRQQDLLLEQGYSALMGMTKGGYGPTERQAIANLVSRGVDGLILNHVPGDPETNEVLMGLAAEGLPIGMLGIHHLKGIDCVGYDTSLMAAQIVHHLVELGHRRIGIISWSTHSRRGSRVPAGFARPPAYVPPRLRIHCRRVPHGNGRLNRPDPGSSRAAHGHSDCR